NIGRRLLARNPWTLTGGGAVQLKERIEAGNRSSLESCAAEIGFGAVTREDDAYMLGSRALARWGVPLTHRRPLVEGKAVREWLVESHEEPLWPYNAETPDAEDDPQRLRLLCAHRK